MALLAALVTEGPLTATQAAALVDATPSNCSVAPAQARRARLRPGDPGSHRPAAALQMVSEGLSWGDDPTESPEAADALAADALAADALAADALADVLVEREVQRLRAARASRDREPPAWREATGLTHTQLWLTAAEAAEVRAALSVLSCEDHLADKLCRRCF